MSLLRRLRDAVQDPLFWRVTVFLLGLPFVGLGVAGIVALAPPDGWWWLATAVLAALAAYGGFLVYAACFGSEALFDRATSSIHDGGDLLAALLIIAVGLVAIPVTVLLRLVYPRHRDAL